jgi:hypothetical protein
MYYFGRWGGRGIHIQTNFLFYVSQTFELNIFPNHHQLDDQQVQEYLTTPNIWSYYDYYVENIN